MINQAKSRLPKKTHLIANLPYWIKQHQSHHKYLRVHLDTCVDVNIMPKSVYQMMFNDPDVKHLADNDISLEVYVMPARIVGGRLLLKHTDETAMSEVAGQHRI